jgi:hypothetical protein
MNAMVAGLSIELANSCENVDKYVDKCSKLWKSQKDLGVAKDKKGKYLVGTGL